MAQSTASSAPKDSQPRKNSLVLEARSGPIGVAHFARRDFCSLFVPGLPHFVGEEGETTDDLYAFLTCPPRAEVKAIHPKAMPVILTEPDEWKAWMSGEPAKNMQRPLHDESLWLIDEPI